MLGKHSRRAPRRRLLLVASLLAGTVASVLGIQELSFASSTPTATVFAGTPALKPGEPFSQAFAGYSGPEGMAVDAAGDIFHVDAGAVLFTPAASGTYFGQTMTVGDSYPIAGTGTSSSSDVVATTMALGQYPKIATDAAGNLAVATSNEVVLVPIQSALLFGQTEQAGYGYLVAGGAGTSSSPVPSGAPATASPFCSIGAVAIDPADDLFVSDACGSSYYIAEVPQSSSTQFGVSMGSGNVYHVDSSLPSGVYALGATASGVLFPINGPPNYVYFLPAATCSSSCPYGLASTTAGTAAQIAFRNSSSLGSLSVSPSGVPLTADQSGDYWSFPSNGVVNTIASSFGANTFSGLGGPLSSAMFGTSSSGLFENALGYYLTETATGNSIFFSPLSSGTYYGQAMTGRDVYLLAGYASPSSFASTTSLGAPVGQVLATREGVVEWMNNAFRFAPFASGTYFGQAMTAGNSYLIAGNGTYGTSFTTGIPATQDALPSNATTDSAGDLWLYNQHAAYEVPVDSGTYFGQTMTAGDLYQAVTVSSTVMSAAIGSLAIDGSGNLYATSFSSYCVVMVPAASGTYFGQAMTAGSTYVIAGQCGNGGATSTGVTATSTKLNYINHVAVDGAGDVFFDNYVSGPYELMMVPARSGTYFGQAMTADDLYVVVASVPVNEWGVDSSGNVYSYSGTQIHFDPISSGSSWGVATTAGTPITIAGLSPSEYAFPPTVPTTPLSVPLDESGGASFSAASDGSLYVADITNMIVWKMSPPAIAPTITSGASTTFTTGVAGSFTVTTSGSPVASLTETGTLPAGVAFTDNGDGTASLAGTPAAASAGTYSFTVTAANGTSPNATQSFTLTVDAAPTITSAASASFTSGASGSFTVQTTGSPTPSLTETGTLPTGVTFTDNGDGTATLSGTASGAVGAYDVTITATNGVGAAATQSFVLAIDQAPTITSSASASFAKGTSSSFTVTTSGYPVPAITETGTLPTGVTFLDNGNGTASLSGTPTQAGSFPLTITADNGVGTAASESFALTITAPPAFTNATSTSFVKGAAGNFSFTTSGYPTPSLTETGTLPAGVTFLDNGDGTATLSGTPSGSTGAYGLSITASNGVGTAATQSFALAVDAAPGITSAAASTFSTTSANSFVIQTSGYPTPSLTETGTLPSGVTFIDNGDGTATLSGTPASGGTFTISITASNGIGTAATQSFALDVNGASAITSVTAATATAGTADSFTVTTTGYPAPALTETGTLPAGMSFIDNGDGTATLSGTAASTAGGLYPLTITADNGVGTAATQSFTLTIDAAPAITSAASTSFTTNTAGSFTATTTGYPVPTLTETGTLPAGVTFTDNGDGTATLAGTTTAAGSSPLTITADNGIGTTATQSFTLTVAAPAPAHQSGTGTQQPFPTTTTPAPPPLAPSTTPAVPDGFGVPSAGTASSALPTVVTTTADTTTATVTAPAASLPSGSVLAVAPERGTPVLPSQVPNADAPVTAFAVALTAPGGAAPEHAAAPVTIHLAGASLHDGDLVYATTPTGPEVIARVTTLGEVDVLVQDATTLFVVAPPTTAVASRIVKADPHVAVVELSCTSGVRCVGTASVLSVARYPGGPGEKATHPAVARAHFSLAAGHRQPFRFAVTAFGRKVLRRAIAAWHHGDGHFGVTLLIQTRDGNRLVARVWLR